MTLETQFKIKSNPDYINYLREKSYWYKYLNRNPDNFEQFENEAKEKLGLRPQDKINKILDTMEMFSALVSNLK